MTVTRNQLDAQKILNDAHHRVCADRGIDTDTAMDIGWSLIDATFALVGDNFRLGGIAQKMDPELDELERLWGL